MVYRVNLQHNGQQLISPPHLHTAATLPGGKLIWCLHLPAKQCAIAQHARQTIELVQRRESSKFIRPDWTGWTLAMPLPWWQHHKHCHAYYYYYSLIIALMLIQLTIRYGAWCRIECIRRQFKTWATWGSAWRLLQSIVDGAIDERRKRLLQDSLDERETLAIGSTADCADNSIFF